eukprot:TRINITY_DN883_c0_g2_i1.p1 TRINITY_DN883_c0_g2~~TRINITY_DN883_c0_g2_i1.p1  ORF type:complete len:480 (-),score=127.03 TRINITY_DN883_c0_g2_i1:37-1476(-)
MATELENFGVYQRILDRFHYLVSLSGDEKVCAAIKYFEHEFKKQTFEPIRRIDIIRLYRGSTSSEGLLFLCGASSGFLYKVLKVFCPIALRLLDTLLQTPNQTFGAVLQEQPLSRLQWLRLDKHMKHSSDDCKRIAVQILTLLKEVKTETEFADILFKKDDAISRYHRKREEMEMQRKAATPSVPPPMAIAPVTPPVTAPVTEPVVTPLVTSAVTPSVVVPDVSTPVLTAPATTPMDSTASQSVLDEDSSDFDDTDSDEIDETTAGPAEIPRPVSVHMALVTPPVAAPMTVRTPDVTTAVGLGQYLVDWHRAMTKSKQDKKQKEELLQKLQRAERSQQVQDIFGKQLEAHQEQLFRVQMQCFGMSPADREMIMAPLRKSIAHTEGIIAKQSGIPRELLGMKVWEVQREVELLDRRINELKADRDLQQARITSQPIDAAALERMINAANDEQLRKLHNRMKVTDNELEVVQGLIMNLTTS